MARLKRDETYEEFRKKRNETQRAWRAENAERVRGYRRTFYDAHVAEVSERNKIYRATYKTELSERNKAYRATYKTEIQERRRAIYPITQGKERERIRIYNCSHREKRAESARYYWSVNPAKKQAHRAIARELLAGRLAAPLACSACLKPALLGIDGRRTIQAHHHLGYEPEHWLDIVWLCASCHRRADNARLKGEGAR